MHYTIFSIDDYNHSFETIKAFTVSDAVSCLKSLWENIKIKTIKKCFKSCTLRASEEETEEQKVLLVEENDIYDDETIDDGADIECLTRSAGINDFDPDIRLLENIEFYDDLSENWE